MNISITFDLEDPAWQAQVAVLVAALAGGVGAVPVTEPAKPAKAAPKKAGPVEKVLLGLPEPNGADQAEDLGLTDPNMSPAEAKEAGLALVREVYAAGKVKEVKDLQKEWQVAKFYDVPDQKGHEFYQRVMKMAVEAGIRT